MPVWRDQLHSDANDLTGAGNFRPERARAFIVVHARRLAKRVQLANGQARASGLAFDGQIDLLSLSPQRSLNSFALFSTEGCRSRSSTLCASIALSPSHYWPAKWSRSYDRPILPTELGHQISRHNWLQTCLVCAAFSWSQFIGLACLPLPV